MRWLWSAVPALVVACISSVPAQEQSVNRAASGQPNTDIRVGVYVNVRPDCTSGPLPSIQLTSPPENGKVTVKTGNGDQLQAMSGARSAGVRCVLPLARRLCGRRCLDAGSEISGWQDAGAADQCYGGSWIARASHLNDRIMIPPLPRELLVPRITRSALVPVSPGSSSRLQPCA